MMNFMSPRPGFSDEHKGTSTSALVTYTYLHQEALQASLSTGTGGGGSSSAHQPDQPPSDSCDPNNINFHGDGEETNDSDEHMLLRRGGEGNSIPANSIFIEREHMFDKVVTPSDVGKLNRLVIPKQYAEKYFPLDSSTNEKGLLLNFEDRNGKPWRFRYSYWNSSQSYVMTKGWSRFVKEKKLDAGDTVSFQRGVGELGKDRLFIDWRRRPDALERSPPLSIPHHFSNFQRSLHPWNPLYFQSQGPPLTTRDYYTNSSHYFNMANPQHNNYGYGNYVGPNYGCSSTTSVITGNPCSASSFVYVRSAGTVATSTGGALIAPHHQLGTVQMPNGSGGVGQIVFESVPVVQGKAAAKRLRLFGVNMECPISESDECDILSSTTVTHSTMELHHQPPPIFESSSFPNSISFHQSIRPQSMPPDKGKGSMSLDLDI